MRPLFLYLTDTGEFVILQNGKGILHSAGGLARSSPKGGDTMPLTLTFHLFGLVFTLKVKRENRHSAK